jgi:MFS superfamily sulfate permease-like transporter
MMPRQHSPMIREVVAGASVAGLMLPEAVAYAAIAGLAPQHAIVAGIAGGLAYACIGRSRFAIVAPTSSSAAMIAAALATFPAVNGATHAALAALVVAFVGALFLLAGFLRLGSLSGFIARPVLRGFAFGLAVTIILKQLPTLLGLSLHAPNIAALLTDIVRNIAATNILSLSIGATALVALLALRRINGVPGAIIVLVGGVVLSYVVDLPGQHVAQVGVIGANLTLINVPDLPLPLWSRLAQLAVPLTLIVFAESWGTMRSLALAHGDTIAPDRELKALGLSNIAAALVQGMPVGAGFSAGSANAAAGATSRWAAVAAALGLATLLAFGGPWVARIPEPVLAAIVIAALTHALSPAPLRRLWHIDRDQWIATLAAVAVITLGVLNGMLAAVALSVFALLRRLSTPHVSQLGRVGNSHDYIDLNEHPAAKAPIGIDIFRPNAPLFFANAERVLATIASRRTAPRLILSLEESDDIDSSALEALVEFAQSLATKKVSFTLARVHDRARALLEKAGQGDLAASASFSVADAVARYKGAKDAKPD